MILKQSDKISECVHSEDSLLAGFTYQDLMDVVRANCKVVNKEAVELTLRQMAAEAIGHMWENFSIVHEQVFAAVDKEVCDGEEV